MLIKNILKSTLIIVAFHSVQLAKAQNTCDNNQTIIPAELGIIPWPQSVIENSGYFNLSQSSRIVYSDNQLNSCAAILKEDIKKTTGFDLPVVNTALSSNADIELQINPSLSDESYILEVTDKILITGGNNKSVVWAISTLLQAINSDGSVKKIVVNDTPDTNYRGLMLDLARQWHPIDNIKDVINMCRLYKINFLHLHFTDSDSFTFPSQTYPLLATPGRSYTLAELQGLEAYSQARGVTIIPELEVPGHAGKMIQAYPNFFGSGTNGAINFARADVRAAVGELISEMANVFQATPYFHIGCDEVDKSGMSTHPNYINEIAALGVDNVEGLFNYFISEVSAYVKAEGKRALAWEGFDSGRSGAAKVDTDVIVCPFDNYTSADTYANNGHDILNTSWFPLYLIPSTYVPAEKIYNWEVTQFGNYNGASPRTHKNVKQYFVNNTSKIIGAQTCSWEQQSGFEIPSIRSRLSPMAEKIWNTNAGKTFSDYQQRFAKSDNILQKILPTDRPQAITPSASLNIFANEIKILWRSGNQYPDSYTLYRNTSNNSNSATPILSNTTATSYSDTNISTGQTYYYWVKANNSIGTSPFGNSADGRTGTSNLANAYEAFDYGSNTNLSGLNGGTGFNNGWTIVDNNGAAQITNSGLSYPNLVTNSNSLRIDMTGASGSFTANRTLSGSLCPEGSEIWLSFLVKAEKLGSGHSFFILGDKHLGKNWGNGVHFAGTNLQLGYEIGKTHLIVLKIESFNGKDNIHAWTNPDVNGTEPDINDPNCYFTNREDIGTNPRIRLNTQHYDEGIYIYDEFRIGDSFDDILPQIVDAGDSVACDDGDSCTINDTLDQNCNCVGTFIDSDGNGVCDAEEPCARKATDSFNYPANNSLTGNNGGNGFNNNWQTTPMNGSIEVLAGSLNFSDNTSLGNKVRFTLQNEDATKSSSRNLSESFQNGEEVWMSCLIQPILRADGGFWIKPNSRQDIAIGKRWGTQLAIDNNGSSTNVQANTTYKLVVRYKLESNETVTHLWVNRNSDFTDANADATKTVGYISNINSVEISMERWGDGVVEIDELTLSCLAPDIETVCADEIVESNTPDILYNKEANISISTNGKVLSGANVQYNAGEKIELMNGFEVQLGASFNAFIEPCN